MSSRKIHTQCGDSHRVRFTFRGKIHTLSEDIQPIGLAWDIRVQAQEPGTASHISSEASDFKYRKRTRALLVVVDENNIRTRRHEDAINWESPRLMSVSSKLISSAHTACVHDHQPQWAFVAVEVAFDSSHPVNVSIRRIPLSDLFHEEAAIPIVIELRINCCRTPVESKIRSRDEDVPKH